MRSGSPCLISMVLPYLANFDLRQKTVYSTHRAGRHDCRDRRQRRAAWAKSGATAAYAALYAICYSAFALAIGMLLFQTRELGGAEG